MTAGPPVQKGRTKKLLVQAALAGGIASGSTTLMMYPLDTLKTRVQSAAGASVAGIVRSVPSIGLRGLYRCPSSPQGSVNPDTFRVRWVSFLQDLPTGVVQVESLPSP